jgi:hypothetical protein
MGGRNLRRKLAMLLAFAMPLVLLKFTTAFVTGGRLGTGSGPRSAAAQLPSDGEGPHSPMSLIEQQMKATSEQERRVAEYIAQLRQLPFGRNPLYYEPRPERAEVQPSKPIPPPAAQPPLVHDRLEARVQAIMGTREQGGTGSPMALIDGRPYRVGDLVPGGRWEITAIESGTRTVTFRHVGTGEERHRSVATPLR